jgi:hypothetical protein
MVTATRPEDATARVQLADYGYAPSDDEAALLRAVLARAPIPAKLLRRDPPPLDPGVARLLPLLRAHPDLGAAPALGQRVADERRRGAHRYFSLKAELRGVAALLGSAGIEILLLKGFPLATLYYDDVGQRPMSDLDVCVRPERFADAVTLLLAGGFRRYDPEAPDREPPAESALGFAPHATSFANDAGVELDLHCHVLMCAGWDGADDGFWADAQPFRLADRSVLTLDPADHLLHACLHGIVRNPVSPVRWVVDAARLIERAPGGLDWQRLQARACAVDCRGPLLAALRYLKEEHACAIPPDALDDLAQVPFSAVSAEWFRIAGRREPPATGVRRRVARLILDYRRHMRGERRPASPFGLLRYFMTKWRIEGYRRLPREILTRCLSPRLR